VLRSLQRRINRTRSQQKQDAVKTDNHKIDSNQDETAKGALLCCILFYCFESALGDTKAAVRHLDSGLRLLNSLREQERDKHRRPTDDFPRFLDQVSEVMARFDLQATALDDTRGPMLALVPLQQRASGLSRPVDIGYPNLDEAQLELSRLLNWLFHMLSESLAQDPTQKLMPPPAVLQEKQRLFDAMDTFERRLSLFEPKTDAEVCGMRMLLVHKHTARMVLASRLPNDDTVFGSSPNPMCEEIVRLSEKVLDFTSGQVNSTTGQKRRQGSVFSSEMGVVVPLSVVALRCADRSVSQRAVELMVESQRREGLHDALSMVTVAQKVNALREKERLEMEALLGESDRFNTIANMMRKFKEKDDGVMEGLC